MSSSPTNIIISHHRSINTITSPHLISSLCVSSLREWSHDILHTSWWRVRADVLSIEHPGDCWWWRIIVHPYIDPYIIIIIISSSIDQSLMNSLLHRHTRIINHFTSLLLLVHTYSWLLHNLHLWRRWCYHTVLYYRWSLWYGWKQWWSHTAIPASNTWSKPSLNSRPGQSLTTWRSSSRYPGM
jgi:hypothetical protein